MREGKLIEGEKVLDREILSFRYVFFKVSFNLFVILFFCVIEY